MTQASQSKHSVNLPNHKAQRWVLVGFGVAMLAVAILAGFAMYRSSEVSTIIQTNKRIDAFQEGMMNMMVELYKAESNIREYTLSKDKTMEGVVFVASEMSKKRLIKLEEMATAIGDSSIINDVAVLKTFLALKYSNMRDITVYVSAQNYLETLYENIEDTTDLSRLIDSQKSLESSDRMAVYFPDLDSMGLENILLNGEINDQQWKKTLAQIAQANDSLEEYIKGHIEQDHRANERLDNVLTGIQAKLANMTDELGEIDEEAQDTFFFMLIFGIAVVLMEFAFLGFIINHLDKNRQLQEELHQQKEQAEHHARVKEDFLANMSHEIRTPMNAVIGFADQLAQTSLDQIQGKLLNPLRHSARYLLALINDILDYSKLESGNFPLEEVGYDPSSLVTEVYETFVQEAKKKGLALKLNIKGALPAVLIGDPLRLKQILFNLINNALKFTERGHVAIIVAARNSPQGKVAMLEFEVQDTGIGIPRNKQKDIFSKFIQVDNSTTRKYGGTGLGLAITSQLVELQNGSITLESEVGKGTRVQLSLPQRIGVAQDLQVMDGPLQIDGSDLVGRKVLLVDDELYNRELAEYILKRWKMKVDAVGNGQQALDKLKTGKSYDIVLMDLQMPVLDGLDAASAIRQKLGLKDLPILAMTATSTPAEIQRALAAGMDAHMLKPFRESELIVQLRRLMKPRSGKAADTSQLEKKVVPVSPVPPSDVVEGTWGYSIEGARTLFNGDIAFMKRMLGIFAKQTREQWQELEHAKENKDWKLVGNRAHAMLPRCRNLGLKTIVTDLKEIETVALRDEPVSAELIDGVRGRLFEVIEAVEADLKNLEGNE